MNASAGGFTADGTIKLSGCRSAMIKNQGTATATLWGSVTLNTNDAPIIFPSYPDDTERWDEIPVTFGAGTKQLIVIRDIVFSCK